MEQRTGEAKSVHGRAGRFYSIAEQWYFSSREDLQVGPFASRNAAEDALQNFLRHIKETTARTEPATGSID